MNRVGIDLRATEPGFKAHFGRGTGRYAGEVARRLFSAPPPDLDLFRISGKDLIAGRVGQMLVRLSPIGKVTLETQLLLSRRLSKLGVDLVHFFAHGDAPARLTTPYVVTVLDLIPLRFAELYKARNMGLRFHLARFLELESIRRASGMLAISECTKRDLVELLGVCPDRVTVTPLGVDSRFTPGGEDSASREQACVRLNLPPRRPIVSYVGGIDPRKNVPFLLEVFAELLRVSSRNGSGEHRPFLVLAGQYAREQEYPALVERIRQLSLSDDLRLVGFLSDENLVRLYRVSTLFVFPSLYEGFGLPVLEAMACGCPVVAGRNSSIPEVAGDAALLLPDHDRSAWREAIHRLLEDDAERLRLRHAGLSQARRFTWEGTVAQTVGAYRRVLGLPELAPSLSPHCAASGSRK